MNFLLFPFVCFMVFNDYGIVFQISTHAYQDIEK